jgi:hypothetical protein
MSERRERSFLRRARESRDAVDGEPSKGPEAMSDPPESQLGETEPPEPGGYRRGSELRRSMAIAAERVDEIITTAHQMAEEIRREAEAEADRLVEIRRREADLIAEERLAGVRAALGALRVEIDQIERRMIEAARGPTEPPSAQTDPPRRGPQVVQTSVYPGVASERAGEPSERPRWADERAAALIRASQLAVQGESRERIETVLRDDFGIQEPAEIVDEILPRPR